VILATVSSDPDFHKDVRASLDGHVRFETAWDLSFEDAVRLLGISAEEKCLLILDFAAAPQALPVARSVDGRPQIATIALRGGGSREEMLVLMQVGVRDVLPSFTARELRQAASRAPLSWRARMTFWAKCSPSCPPSRAAAQPPPPPTPLRWPPK
jgi:hypothetical protein